MKNHPDRTPAEDPGGVLQEEAHGESRETSRREYALWAPEEERIFYNVLKSCVGERTLVIVSKCCEAIPSKDYNQVRDYYYRLQKRLNRLLAKELQFDGKSPAPLHQAMLKFWEVLSSNGLHGTNLRAMKNQPRKRKMLSMAVVKSIRGTLARARAQENGKKREEGSVHSKGAPATRRAKVKPPAPPTVLQQSENNGGNLALVVGGDPVALPEPRVLGGVPAAATPVALPPSPPAPLSTLPRVKSQTQTPQCMHPLPPAVVGPASVEELRVPRGSPQAPQVPVVSSGPASSGSGSKGLKVELRLAPCTIEVQSRIETFGHAPFVELVCCPSKSVLSVLAKMEKKWASALTVDGPSLSILLRDPITLAPIDLGAGNDALKVGELLSRLSCPAPLELRYSLVATAMETVRDPAEESGSTAHVLPAFQTTPAPSSGFPGAAIGTPPSAELRPLERTPMLFSSGFLTDAPPLSTGQHPWCRLQNAPEGLRTGDTPPTGNASGAKDSLTVDALEGALFGLSERRTQLTTPGPILGLGESSLRSWPDLSPPSLHGEFSSLSKLGGASNFSRFFNSFSNGGCSNAGGELALPSERSLSAHPGDALDLRPERNILSSLLGTPGSDTYDCPDRCDGETPCHRPFATLFDS